MADPQDGQGAVSHEAFGPSLSRPLDHRYAAIECQQIKSLSLQGEEGDHGREGLGGIEGEKESGRAHPALLWRKGAEGSGREREDGWGKREHVGRSQEEVVAGVNEGGR